jgi:5-methyltetrahydrofolate--homocysteine methyltransferase
MEENLKELNELGITVPVILGGAALTRSYAEGYLRGIYKGRVLYGKDAFEGLRVMDHLASGRLEVLDAEVDARLGARSEAKRAHDARRAEEASTPAAGVAVVVEGRRSDVIRDNPVPIPPFWGSRVIDTVPIEHVFGYINPTALFSVQWQIKRGKKTKEEHQREIEDIARPTFERLKARCVAEKILTPKVVYGYFPVSSDGDDLIVFDPVEHDREIERFTFPRQGHEHGAGRRLCIADYFRDLDECRALGRPDVLGMSCVTVGRRVSQVCKALFDANEYKEYLYLHGMGVESAEGLAELWHKRMRQELGFGHEDSTKISELFQQKYRGSRYSFGYPACPEMSDQDKLWKLIDPTRIGCALTENWQIDPEQSTSAIVVHHPQAKYFNT